MKLVEKQLQVQNIYLSIPALIGLGYILYITQSFMIPFTVAVLFGILFAPFLTFLSRRGIPESIGSLIIFLGIFILFTLLGLIVFQAVSSVAASVGKYEKQFEEIINYISLFTEKNFDLSFKEEFLGSEKKEFFTILSPAEIISTINQSVGSFVGFFTNLLLMLLFLMFILLGRKVLTDKFFKFLASQSMENNHSVEIIHSITQQIQNYLWLKTIISLATGLAIYFTALMFGLDFAIVWGFLGFILNYIPSIGPILASVPPIMLAYFQFYDNWLFATVLSVLILTIQFVSGNIIEPKIMGDKLNLNIIVVLLCLFVWGMIWGFAGMVLSVPLTASLNIIFNNSPRYKHISILLSN